MNTIKTYKLNTEEYKRLQAAAEMLTTYNENGNIWTVEDTYFDLGQDWMWTTLICRRPDGESYQTCPTAQERVVTANTPQEMGEAVAYILKNKF